MGHGDEEQGGAAEDEEGEGGAGAGEGPGVVVFDPDGLVAVDHPFHRLTHYLHRNDDAEACVPEQREKQMLHFRGADCVDITVSSCLHRETVG